MKSRQTRWPPWREARKINVEGNARRTIWLAVCAMLLLGGCAPVETTSQSFVMNTVLDQTVYGSQEVCDENVRIAQVLEQKMSRTSDSSEIYAAVHADGPVEASTDTISLLEACLEEWKRTGGAFDPSLGALRDLWGFGEAVPSVPDSVQIREALNTPRTDAVSIEEGCLLSAGGADLDLGGAAKGYALDKMRESMVAEGVQSALISFGGAVLAHGTKPDGSDWRIGLRDPFSAGNLAPIAKMDVSNLFVETSGIAQQSFECDGVLYHHILDPDTGYPADTGLAAVTVCSDSGTLADIYSTALFVMGPEEGMRFAKENDIAAIFMTMDRRILTSPAFTWKLQDLDEEYTLE